MGGWLDVLAAVLTGLAVLLISLALLPSASLRRRVGKRLEEFVGALDTSLFRDSPRQNRARMLAARLRLTRLAVAPGRFVAPGLVVIGSLVVLAVTRDPILTVAAVILMFVFAGLWGQDLIGARLRALDAQMLPTVLQMSASLRAGASLQQAMEVVAREGPYPTREEFQRALDEVAVGSALDIALARLAGRVGTRDYQAFSVVLTVQRRVGGNLALVLDSLADTVRERVELRQEVESLTAQQRLSSWILVLLPIGTAAMFWFTDRSFMLPLVTTVVGRLLVLLAVLMLAAGSWVMRLVGRVEA